MLKRTEKKKLFNSTKIIFFKYFLITTAVKGIPKTLQRNHTVCIEQKFDLFFTLFLTGIEDNLKDLAYVQKKIRLSGGGLLLCVVFLLCISVSVMMYKQNLSKTIHFLRS